MVHKSRRRIFCVKQFAECFTGPFCAGPFPEKLVAKKQIVDIVDNVDSPQKSLRTQSASVCARHIGNLLAV